MAIGHLPRRLARACIRSFCDDGVRLPHIACIDHAARLYRSSPSALPCSQERLLERADRKRTTPWDREKCYNFSYGKIIVVSIISVEIFLCV